MKGVAGFIGIVAAAYIFWITFEFIQFKWKSRKNKKSNNLKNNENEIK